MHFHSFVFQSDMFPRTSLDMDFIGVHDLGSISDEVLVRWRNLLIIPVQGIPLTAFRQRVAVSLYLAFTSATLFESALPSAAKPAFLV